MATPIQPKNTGKQGNSEWKPFAFSFDCSDPNVNFTDGLYQTDITLKNGSLNYAAAIKYEQDLSIFPIGVIIEIVLADGTIINKDTTPVANVPNNYAFGNQAAFANVIDPNNSPVFVRLTGITGSGVAALKFTVSIVNCEITA